MFRLMTPITCARPISDFDDISTIITHSSLTGSKKAAPWQQHVGEDGHVFYIELTHASHTQTFSARKTDTSSVCSLCSTRSCHSCASEDTGYSSDTDTLSTQPRNRKSERAVLDLSHESASSHSRVADLDDVDDGVSVDLSVLDQQHEDGDLCERLTHECSVANPRLRTRCRGSVGCTRASSLCERHSNKLSVLDCPKSDQSSDHHQTCKCGGQSGSALLSNSKRRQQDSHKEIVLHLRPSGHVWDSRSKISWLESVLGIIPGHVDNSSIQGEKKDNGTNSERVIVKGLAPDGPAIKNKDLLIGDHIYSINGRQVTWSNLDSVLSSLHQTRKVRLTVLRSSGFPHQSAAANSDRLLLDSGSVLRVLLDSHAASTASRGRGSGDGMEGVCVVYMSMQGVDSDDKTQKEDVVYQFPREESVLSRMRGSFFTLDHLLTDNVDTDVRLLTVCVDGSLINVACRKEGPDMLIVTAPAKRLQSHQLLTVTNGLMRLLRLLYGSVEQAFCSEQHHGSLDEFLSFLFSALAPSFRGDHISVQAPLLGYMAYLPLPDDVVVSITNTLTEFESADFADMSDSFYGCRRAFTVLGSMVLYKGRVTCCHLNPEDAGDVGLYLNHSGLLGLSAKHSLHQMLVWREIFPTRLCHEVFGINSVFGYSEPHARWYLMVVGVKNTLLACILEAGGCSAQFEGVRLPDPFYVDQARAALVQLQTADIISACEIRLSGDGLPATTTADKVVSHLSSLESSHRGLDSFIKTTASLALSLNNGHHANNLVALNNIPILPGGGPSPNRACREWRKASIDSDGSSGSGSSNEGYFKTHRKKGRLFPPPAVPTSAVNRPGIVVDSDVNTCKLSSGKENALLVFCQVNEQEGVLITSPADSESRVGWGSLHQQVVDNFYRCAAQIHADFIAQAKAKVYPNEGVLEDFHGNMSFNSCREEGVMFTCTLGDRGDGKKSAHSLVYWVVGRKFRNLHSREVYVCFHESAPQNVIELAFRLSLGSLSSS